jgi:hypothetical protein
LGELQYAAPAEALVGVSAPSGTVAIGQPAGVAFAVKALARDGVTGEPNKAIVFSAAGGGVQFGACGGAATCPVMTDASGVARSMVTATVQEGVVLSAVGTMGTVTGAFTAGPVLPDVLRLVGAPAGTMTVGVVAPVAFAVSLMAADGVTPRARQAVTFTATGGGVVFGACGAATCTVTTDAGGGASTMLTPTIAGVVTLRAASATTSVSRTVTAAAETMGLVSAPSGTGTVGEVAGTAFAVKVLAGDGTPEVGTAVVFSATGGVRFRSCVTTTCADGPVLTVLTDVTGVASVTVTPLTAGTATMSAVGRAGSKTSALTSVVRMRTVTAMRAVEYVAEGATVVWKPQVVVADNAGSASGAVVSWTSPNPASGGMGFAAATSMVDVQGGAGMAATLGPLAAGAEADGTGCVWGSVCAGFAAKGVSLDALRVEVVSGGGQTVSSADTLGAVVLRVTDGAGDPVAGASVAVHQTVSEWEPACPEQGRCPVAAVYGAGVTTGVSDVDGLLTVTPMQMAGTAEVTQIAAVTGTQGVVTVALAKQP